MKIVNAGGRIVNTYLYPVQEGGYVLVDTGYPGAFPRFLRRLRRAGIDVRDIAWVFLTHAHDDHAGFLNELLRAAPRARLVLHSGAPTRLARGQNPFQGGCTSRLALGFCRMMKLFGRGDHRFPPLCEALKDRIAIADGEKRPELEAALRGSIHETPGHTGDSISLLLRDGSLFCGDAAMNGFPSLHKITIWVEDREAFCASWEKIIHLQPRRIYPGHGRPLHWQALKENLRRARAMALRALAPEKCRGCGEILCRRMKSCSFR